jgi:hypothetical protein
MEDQEPKELSRPQLFIHIFLVMFLASIMFQLLLARDDIAGFADAFRQVLLSVRSSLGVALIAAGALVLVRRTRDVRDDD